MKLLYILFFLALPCNGLVISWNVNPEPNVVGYKVWKETSGTYTLLGTVQTNSFDLGTIAERTNISVSAIASNQFQTVDGEKSETLTIDPNELPPYTYVSLIGEKKHTFAMSKGHSKRFFRFDIQTDSATLQTSFDLISWNNLSTFSIGNGYGDAKVLIGDR